MKLDTVMDLSRDPHRGVTDELGAVHHQANSRRPISEGNQNAFFPRRPHGAATAEALINGEHSPEGFANLLNESTTTTGTDQSSLPTIITGPFQERTLAPSWLLILFAAPLIVVLLVWLLILLRRRLEQTHHHYLVNYHNIISDQSCPGQVFQHQHHKEAHLAHNHLYKQHNNNNNRRDNNKLTAISAPSNKSKSSKASNHHHRTHTAHFLLESSSSDASTSSTSTCGCSPAASPAGYNNGASCVLSRRSKSAQGVLADPMRSLLDHMHLYLMTLTYQEIFACLVAFTVAILNIVRMRNLFCCNLIIFVLITSKLFSLLTLTTFSLTKLVKLFKLKPIEHHEEREHTNSDTSGSSRSTNDKNTLSLIEDSSPRQQEKVQDKLVEPKTTNPRNKSPLGSLPIDMSPVQLKTILGDASSDTKNILKSKQPLAVGQQQERRRSSSPYDTNATICRLIEKDTRGKQNTDDISTEISEESSCSSQQDIHVGSSLTKSRSSMVNLSPGDVEFEPHKLKLRSNCKTSEPIACRLMLIGVASSTLALICLYLRLMPLSGPLLLSLPENLNRSGSSGPDWSISIYAPSTTTEASTRYSSAADESSKTSTTNNQANNQQQQQQQQQSQQQPNYQATWSARFQQSSQLRHLIDQYELQNFITLLSDTHLQTSRFMCTLAANNYAPIAKLSMMSLYAALMLLILIFSIAIQQVGRRKLRQLELACFGGGVGSSILLANYPSWLYNNNNNSYSNQLNFIAADFPMGLYGNASQQKPTDSNRKRYSDLLKQTMAKQQQSSLDISSSSASRRLRHQRQQTRKSKLRNSSSMSSLLVTPTMISGGRLGEPTNTTFSASVDRYPPVPLSATNNNGKFYQQQAASRQTHLKRLISAQSMCNLAPDNHHHRHQQQQQQQQQLVGNNSKIPVGRLASSGGQLAWLPLGSAATVASLSNIGRDPPTSTLEESEEDSWSRQLIATRLKSSPDKSNNKANRQRANRRTGDRERLGSIGEHLVDCASTLEERDEKEAKLDSKLNKLPTKNGLRGRKTKKTNLNADCADAGLESSSSPATSSSASTVKQALIKAKQQQQQQHQLEQHLKQRTSSWPLYSNQHDSQQSQYQCQQLDHREAVKRRLNYAELKRDLRLSQSVILFGQLLNHAPILLLLAIANLAPDGLIAGWNSSHDNGFVWLTIIEALALPLLLCTLDPSLTLALKRSLRCAVGSGKSTAASAKLSKAGNSESQFGAGARLHFGATSASTGARLAASQPAPPTNRCVSSSDLILGPSAAYPDFMFACQRHISAREAPVEVGGIKFPTASQVKGINTSSYQPLTGPPYLAGETNTKQHSEQLNIDTKEDSLHANFALMSKDPFRNLALRSNLRSVDALSCSLVGTGDLLASRRARYSEFVSSRRKRRRRTSALLSATKRLLRLSKPQTDSKAHHRHRAASTCLAPIVATSSLSFAYSNSNSNSSTADTNRKKTNKQQTEGQMSPTSSLSTLIRKFNHDNYTNVCQQYEQRKQQIAVEEGSLDRISQNNNPQLGAAIPGKQSDEILIDGLDGTTDSEKGQVFPSSQHQQQKVGNQNELLDEKGIFCRKGGLYYNYSLDSNQENQPKTGTSEAEKCGSRPDKSVMSRVNPMLQVAASSTTKQSSEVITFGSGSTRVKAGATGCLLDGPFQQTEFESKAKGDSKELLFDSGGKRRQGSDKNMCKVEGKDLAAIKGVKKGRKSSISSSVENHSNGNKQNVSNNNSGNNNETIISNITSVRELLDKMNGIMAKQEPEDSAKSKSGKAAQAGTGGRSSRNGSDSAGKQSSSTNKSGRNNKTILEMVTNNNNNNNNSASGSNKQSDTCANQVRQLTAAIATAANSTNQLQAANFYEHPTNHNSTSFNCNTLDAATLDYTSLRSVDDALSLVSVSSEFEYHNINQGFITSSQPAVGVSSSHNNNSGGNHSEQANNKQSDSTTASTSTTIAAASSDENCSPASTFNLKLNAETDRKDRRGGVSGDAHQKSKDLTNVSSPGPGPCLALAPALAPTATQFHSNLGQVESKRLEDLRFPSFLPTKSQIAAATDSESNQKLTRLPTAKTNTPIAKHLDLKQASTNKSLSPVFASNKTSSSLLNLTTSKFALALNNQGSSSNQSQNQNQISNPTKAASQSQSQSQKQIASRHGQLGLLPSKSAGSSNTITKQKRGGKERVVTLAEFSSRQSSSEVAAECSLPSESGNVRARIRKMEQQSSTPNLANSSQAKQQQQQASNNSQNRAASNQRLPQLGSMIPVTSASRLPVLTSSNVQLASNNSNGNNHKSLSQAQRLFSSSSSRNNTNIQHENRKGNISTSQQQALSQSKSSLQSKH